MSQNSDIQWTDNTWPPVTGCEFASPGCINCYALKDSWRLSHNPNPKVSEPYEGTAVKAANGKLQWSGLVKTHPDRLDWPLKWNKPSRIFVCNMADLFHEDVPFAFIDSVFAIMAIAHQHTYQVLTKRSKRIKEYFGDRNRARWITDAALDFLRDEKNPLRWKYPVEKFSVRIPLPNVWLGVSVENQKAADDRIPDLISTPAAIRFLSCEPLLEAVNLSTWLPIEWSELAEEWIEAWPEKNAYNGMIHQIIIGGESGANARPCHLDWVRSLVSQCRVAGVPVFVKQLGQNPIDSVPYIEGVARNHFHFQLKLKDRKGGDMSEWPEDLRIRRFPVK